MGSFRLPILALSRLIRTFDPDPPLAVPLPGFRSFAAKPLGSGKGLRSGRAGADAVRLLIGHENHGPQVVGLLDEDREVLFPGARALEFASVLRRNQAFRRLDPALPFGESGQNIRQILPPARDDRGLPLATVRSGRTFDEEIETCTLILLERHLNLPCLSARFPFPFRSPLYSNHPVSLVNLFFFRLTFRVLAARYARNLHWLRACFGSKRLFESLDR